MSAVEDQDSPEVDNKPSRHGFQAMNGVTYRFIDGKREWFADVAPRIVEKVSRLTGMETPGERPPITDYKISVISPSNPVPVEFYIDREELSKMGWLEKHGVHEARPRTQAGIGALVNSMMPSANRAPIVLAPEHTGWLTLRDGSRVYVAANGVVGEIRTGEQIVTMAISNALKDVRVDLERELDGELDLQHFLQQVELAPDFLTVISLGAVLRSVIGVPGRFSIYIAGMQGTGKSGLISCFLQNIATGTKRQGAGGRTLGGSTLNYALDSLFVFRDTALFIDDLTQEGDQHQQKVIAEKLARAVHDGVGRGRLDRKSEARDVKVPKVGAFFMAGEFPVFEEGTSIESRVVQLVVPSRDTIRKTAKEHGSLSLEGMDTQDSISRRSAVVVAFLRHLTSYSTHDNGGDSASLFAVEFARREKEAVTLLANHLPGGVDSRFIDMLAQVLLGWTWFLEWARDDGHLEADTHDLFQLRVLNALSFAAQDRFHGTAQVAMGEHIVAAFRSALRAKTAHIASPAGGAPSMRDNVEMEDLESIPLVFGWSRGARDKHGDLEWRSNGKKVGSISKNGRLHLDPSIFVEVVTPYLPDSMSTMRDVTLFEHLGEFGGLTLNYEFRALQGRRYKSRVRVMGAQEWMLDADPEVLMGLTVAGSGGHGVVRTEQAQEDAAQILPQVEDVQGLLLPADATEAEITASVWGDAAGELIDPEVDPEVESEVDGEPDFESSGEGPLRVEHDDDSDQPRPEVDSGLADIAAGLPGRLSRAWAVLDEDGWFFPDGKKFADFDPTMHVGELAALAHGKLSSRPTVWVTESARAALSLPAAAEAANKKPHAWIARALKDGFSVQNLQEKSRFAATVKVWRATEDGTGMTLVRFEFPSVDLMGMGFDSPSKEDMLFALAHYSSQVGSAYSTSARAGYDVLVRLRNNKKTRYTIDVEDVPEGYEELYLDKYETLHLRQPLPSEGECVYVHGYDVNSSYASAASDITLGYGTTSLETSPEFDKKRKGLWKVEIPRELAARVEGAPDVFGVFGQDRGHGQRWWPTELVELAVKDYGYELEIEEALLWAEAGYILKPLVKHFDDGRHNLEILAEDGSRGALAARGMMKQVLNKFIGWLRSDRHNETYYRPEWNAGIVGYAYAKISRDVLKVAKSGHTPVAQFRDALYFLSSEPDPLVFAQSIGLEVKPNKGKWKVIGTTEAASAAEVWLHTDGKSKWLYPTPDKLQVLKNLVDASGHGAGGE